MSVNVKTGSYWERRDQPEEEDQDEASGESKLFLNRKAQREYRINEMYRRKARKQFEKTIAGEEGGEEDDDGKATPEEADKTPEPVVKVEEDDDEDEEEKAKKRKERKVCK